MRSEIIKSRNINNPRTGLKARRYNPRLQIIRPSPVSTTRLDNFASPNKSLTIRHAKLQLLPKIFWQKPQCSETREINGM
jgi:hypothetical protein